MQLLRFALVQHRHARLNENSALRGNRLHDLQAESLAASSSQNNG
jgi:hypothetical protein